MAPQGARVKRRNVDCVGRIQLPRADFPGDRPASVPSGRSARNGRRKPEIDDRRGRRTRLSLLASDAGGYLPGVFAAYVLLKPLRVLVTVNVPSGCAETLIQYAVLLCCGGGGTLGPGGGAVIGAIGIAVSGSSSTLAINLPGTVYSCPLS